tara:strand:+ start:390 stop:563 length:174 start_codon:yes stop_codon:yes gene_type:complete
MLTRLKNWTLDRKNERTSWDGILMIIMAVVVLMGSPFVKLAAYAVIVWGLWTIWKAE